MKSQKNDKSYSASLIKCAKFFYTNFVMLSLSVGVCTYISGCTPSISQIGNSDKASGSVFVIDNSQKMAGFENRTNTNSQITNSNDNQASTDITISDSFGNEELQEAKVEIFANKMQLADFTWMAVNDVKFVKQVIEYNNQSIVSDEYTQCIYNNIDRDTYSREFNEVAQYLVNNYPNDIAAYNTKLNYLAPIVKKIFSHPTPVSFNTNNMLNSSAMKILEPYEAIMLNDTIKDKRYTPLMVALGLPAISDQGRIQDISVMQIGSLMEYVLAARVHCQ